MKISLLLSIASIGSFNAKFMGNDALAAEGMLKLGIHLTKNGLPSPETCTLDTAAVRREWRVCTKPPRIKF
ncbi:hypothetical protein ACJQWK_00359 [Exserohilum turcicum]